MHAAQLRVHVSSELFHDLDLSEGATCAPVSPQSARYRLAHRSYLHLRELAHKDSRACGTAREAAYAHMHNRYVAHRRSHASWRAYSCACVRRGPFATRVLQNKRFHTGKVFCASMCVRAIITYVCVCVRACARARQGMCLLARRGMGRERRGRTGLREGRAPHISPTQTTCQEGCADWSRPHIVFNFGPQSGLQETAPTIWLVGG